jgi:hypothetical protein
MALCGHIQNGQEARKRKWRNESLERLLVDPAACELLVFSCAYKRRFRERSIGFANL